MTFETLPVVHLHEGGFPEYPQDDPERVLTTLARRFGRVVIVDVAGVRANDVDLEFIQTSSRRRALWVDGGSRFATDAMDLFVAGAEAVSIRWNTLAGPDELEEAAQLCQPGTLFLALEFPGGRFLRNPDDARDAADVVRFAESHGVGVVYIVDREDPDALRALPTAATPRFLQGPVSPELAQSMGFQGTMLAPTLLPEESRA